MLARYKILRGKQAAENALPQGIRQDTRKHTRHCLRPTEELVSDFLDDPSDDAWKQFATSYRDLLEQRFTTDREPFDNLAELAGKDDVYIGCSCPTKKNPNVNHCHTVEALHFLQEKYPELDVRFPDDE